MVPFIYFSHSKFLGCDKERASGKPRRAGGTNGMVKARVAPATELLKDVVRVPRLASSEALPWWHPFALSHFLEGVQERCLWQNPRQALPQQGVAGHQAKPFPLYWEGGSEGLFPLWGGKLVREGFSPGREKVAYQRRLRTYPTG
jgi:hypothetical protein